MNLFTLIKKFLLLITTCSILFLFQQNAYASVQEAIFAGGCFWCLEHDLEYLPGVLSAESGYSGGQIKNPTYRNHKGHQESVKLIFDPSKISFEDLLRNFWRNIDPFDSSGQFCDQGDSYRPIIFYIDDEQKKTANKSFQKAAQELSVDLNDIAVETKKLNKFWPAEEYHQDFAKKNSVKYNFYRYTCGRDNRLEKVWGSNARKGFKWNID